MNQSWMKFLPAAIKSKLEDRPTLQNIVTNTGWLFLDKIIRMGVGLAVSIWVARYLGPSQFGTLNYAVAFVALFSAVANLGLDSIVVRNIVRHPQEKHDILGSAFILRLLGGIAVVIISQVTIYFFRPADNLTHWLVGITAAGMIFQSFDTIDLWFQSQVISKYTVYAKNAAFLALALVKILLILNHAPLILFAWAGLSEIILGAFGLMLAYRINHQYLSAWRINLNQVQELLCESWPLILSGLSVMIYMRIDQVMLAQMVGDAEVGLYSAALRFSEVWYFIPSIIVTSVLPSIIRAKTLSEELYYERLEQLYNLLVRIAYALAIPMTFISTPLVTYLYGIQYTNAGAILSIHIWTALFVFMGVGITPWIINEGFTRFSFVQTSLGATTNIILNIILIPKYGAKGAACATVISQITAAYLALIFLKKTKKIFIIETKAIFLIGNIHAIIGCILSDKMRSVSPSSHVSMKSKTSAKGRFIP